MQTVTMEDVAREAGVSRALVSLAYRDAYGVSVETREHILSVGKKLGYRPNRVAAQLAGKEQLTIGVFLQDLHNDLFADIHDGIREVTDTGGKHTVLAVGKIDGSKDVEALETLLENRVDIVIAAGLTLSDRALKKYLSRVKVVSVMRQVSGAISIVSDNYRGATEATEYLISLGHRGIAFMANPPSDGYLDRAAGYVATMEAGGLTPRVVPGSYSRQETEVIARALLSDSKRPTAIFAHNDQAALGVLDAAFALGLEPGRDISVVGYDNTSLSKSPSSALTTVDVHAFELGRLAAEEALKQLTETEAELPTITLDPTLVIRTSTGAPASA